MSKSKNKQKVKRLTDEQYNAYISTLKEDPAFYNADGSQFVPSEIDVRSTKSRKGN
jgi:hypothetical protein